jgi:Domain of unknown function (DUF6268)
MKRTFFLAGIVLPILCNAQNADSVHGPLVTTSPRLGGVNLTSLNAPISANGSTFLLHQTVLDVGAPVYKDFTGPHPIVIKTGIRYEGIFIENEKKIGSSTFSSLSLPLIASYSLNRKTSLTLIGLGTVSSDWKSPIQAGDIQYTAGIRLGFQPSQSLRWGVTLTYISNYSGKFLLPLPDIEWAINSKLSLSALVPARISLKYKLSPAQSLGITGGFMGGMYRVTPNAKKQQDQYLNLQQYSGGLIYDLKFTQRWKLTLIGGHTFEQRLETFNMDQKVSFDNFGKLNDRKPNVSYRENSFVFQAGISYVF